ncbi:MAG: peptidoglycan editing factor PgeF [Alphaproteobacteria bacterium]|nr:peptidoglycan editing factor PgeF [Alphaproteobacteria bacterium]
MLEPLQNAEWQTSGVVHGFFARRGGVSTGIYDSLNCGRGSDDSPDAVRENLRRVVRHVGGARLVMAQQVHSTRVITVDADFGDESYPEADGFVTNQPGVMLGILSADCAPILFADVDAGVVGAVHAGWKGALAGIAVQAVAEMCRLGAKRHRIMSVVGPAIAAQSYEVAAEFRAEFLCQDPNHEMHFVSGSKSSKYQFDLEGFLLRQLRGLSLGRVAGLGIDTYPEQQGFFSNRRRVHRAEPDYGRQISVIALPVSGGKG